MIKTEEIQRPPKKGRPERSKQMTRYVTIEANSGYIWWVGEAKDELDACRLSDIESKEDPCEFEYTSDRSDFTYAVYVAPEGWDSVGDDQEKIDQCSSFPFGGRYVRVAS